MRLANALLTETYGNLAKFINEKPPKLGMLKSWLDSLILETTNSSKMSLIVAIYDDVADCAKFAGQVVLVGGGAIAPAERVTQTVTELRERERQRRKALHYAQKLTDSSSLKSHHEAKDSCSFQVDRNCSHRHDKRAKYSKSSKNRAESTRKSSYDLSTSSPSNLSDSSSAELEAAAENQTTSTKRRGRFRKHRSKQFEKSLSKAKKQKTRIPKPSVVDSLHPIYVVTSGTNR